MAMKVIIESSEISSRNGMSNRTGKPYSMRVQQARLKGEWVAGAIELTLGDDQPAYPVGEYDIDFERSVEIGPFGSLNFSRRPVLVPVQAVKGTTVFPGSKTGTNG